MTIDREYQPAEVEERWAADWVARQLFRARSTDAARPFCMVIPPPNVTGDLHIGHVLVYTLHDIIARWRRMQGWDVLWLPGTDHAGIATQMVVERELAREGLTRHELGREGFERRVWQWKERYGGRITEALRRLGASVDWSRERFTLDEGLSRVVRTVFVRLYHEGLIYRGRYIVNWDPVFGTAISDLETEYREVDGQLYTVRYPAAAGSTVDVLVATTRPETMLGDTGVAVHPDDERYRHAVGQRVRVPLTERDVPILADGFVDPQFGTGAVKLTPAHDPADFEAGRRLGLAQLAVIGEDARMTAAAGRYTGLDRFEARERIVADLRQQGLLIEVKPHRHAVGHSQRSGAMIEPLVSEQWFVRVAPLAEAAIRAVEQDRTRFVPANWTKTYFEWMRNIHDWCISRQLWWGHRIPAWFCASCGATTVADDAPERCAACGKGDGLRQDADVLDTWFSSALWPFSTLGWPERTPDLERYYPTSLLITGHDIIFFWVARMMMMGLKFAGDVPFREVYIHGLVRDAQGRKMSKTTGNTVDPAEVQARYGTDAVRFTMAMLAAPGNDIPLAPERMEGYRAFANKLWNATRFVLLRGGDAGGDWRPEELSLADRWILSRAQRTLGQVDAALEQYRFDHAADALYHFAWHQFCDWYIELAKPALAPDTRPEEGRPGSRTAAVLLDVLDQLLRMLHPFMPFVTEELWHKLPGTRRSIAVSAWPETLAARIDEQAEHDLEQLQELVVRIRHLRAENNIDPGRPVRVLLRTEDERARRLLATESPLVARLVRASALEAVDVLPAGAAARGMACGVQIAIPLEGLLDLEAERRRLERELAGLERDLAVRSRRLDDAAFRERAPAEVVEREHRVARELRERKERLLENLVMLSQTD